MSIIGTIPDVAIGYSNQLHYPGPWLVGSNLYTCWLYDSEMPVNDELPRAIKMMKSIDNGATWAEMDSGNRPDITTAPEAVDKNFDGMHGVIDGSGVIHIVTVLDTFNTSGQLYYGQFDTSIDTWLIFEIITDAIIPESIDNALHPPFVSIRSDNSIVVIYRGVINGSGWIAPSASVRVSGVWTKYDFDNTGVTTHYRVRSVAFSNDVFVVVTTNSSGMRFIPFLANDTWGTSVTFSATIYNCLSELYTPLTPDRAKVVDLFTSSAPRLVYYDIDGTIVRGTEALNAPVSAQTNDYRERYYYDVVDDIEYAIYSKASSLTRTFHSNESGGGWSTNTDTDISLDGMIYDSITKFPGGNLHLWAYEYPAGTEPNRTISIYQYTLNYSPIMEGAADINLGLVGNLTQPVVTTAAGTINLEAVGILSNISVRIDIDLVGIESEFQLVVDTSGIVFDIDLDTIEEDILIQHYQDISVEGIDVDIILQQEFFNVAFDLESIDTEFNLLAGGISEINLELEGVDAELFLLSISNEIDIEEIDVDINLVSGGSILFDFNLNGIDSEVVLVTGGFISLDSDIDNIDADNIGFTLDFDLDNIDTDITLLLDFSENLRYAYVMNLSNQGLTVFPEFSFDKLFRFKGRQFSISDGNLYEFVPSELNGFNTEVITHLDKLGTPNHKRVPWLYLDIENATKLNLGVVYDNKKYDEFVTVLPDQIKSTRNLTRRQLFEGRDGNNVGFTIRTLNGETYILYGLELIVRDIGVKI